MSAETPVIKPGYKTTEFWLTVVATTIGLLMASGAITPGSGADRWIGLIATGLASLGYSVSRGLAKQ